jgi:hypothetical protein
VAFTAELLSLVEPDVGPISLGLVVVAIPEALPLGCSHESVHTARVSDGVLVLQEEVKLGADIHDLGESSLDFVPGDFARAIGISYRPPILEIRLAFSRAGPGPVIFQDFVGLSEHVVLGLIIFALRLSQSVPNEPERKLVVLKTFSLFSLKEHHKGIIAVTAHLANDLSGVIVGDGRISALLRELLGLTEVEESPEDLGLVTNALVEEVLSFEAADSSVLNSSLVVFLHVGDLEGVLKVLFDESKFFSIFDKAFDGVLNLIKGQQIVLVKINLREVCVELFHNFVIAEE